MSRGLRVLLAAVALLLLYVLVVNEWVVDDAYITFRTIDNFLHGYGLRWNVDERVQSYTHPLWMMLMTLAASITGEMFYSSIVLSMVVSLAAVWVSAMMASRQAAWKPPLLILALISSKAVVDYMSSGLETPLAYLVAAVFAAAMFSLRSDEEKLSWAVLCASLAFLTRPDAILLYAPAVLYLSWRVRRVQPLFVFSLPITLWIAFSVVYYGFPLPNTAYAKSLGVDFPSGWVVRRGLEYWLNSLEWDSAAHAMLAAAAVLSFRDRFARMVMAGVVLYVALVILSLGAATHMSGRHFAIPMFLAIVVFIHLLDNRRAALACAYVLAGYLVWNPVSPVKFGTPAYVPYAQDWNYIDGKFFVYREGAALIDWRPGRRLPDHNWYHIGELMHDSGDRVFVGVTDPTFNGVSFGEAVGYAGFAAGPEKFIIDVVGLSDPLLARLPADRPDSYEGWKSGHFRRTVPEGYVASVAYNGNLIEDPKVRRLYGAIRTITRGPIWSTRRFTEIAKINLGMYEVP
jgi:arabinofuranosyltransferase